MTSITADLEQLTEGDLRELVLKLAGRDKSKTLLASAHQLALAILERNRAEQAAEPDRAQQPGARCMRLKLSTPLPKVASADFRELAAKDATSDGGLEQYRDEDGNFVYHTGKYLCVFLIDVPKKPFCPGHTHSLNLSHVRSHRRSHLLPRLYQRRRLRHRTLQLDVLRLRRRREQRVRHDRRRST